MKGLVVDVVRALVRKNRPVVFGDLSRSTPLSRHFGRDRGTPVDRHYIEQFLASRRNFITGEVLEVAEDLYTQRFGSGVTATHILHVDPAYGKSTITGDLTDLETLPDSIADCFICTQTYNFIYDYHRAIRGSHKLLKPGGVLLATVSGGSQISLSDADSWGDFYRFTEQSIQRAFTDVFGASNIKVEAYGNLVAAIALLQGLALEDLPSIELLDEQDKQYPIIISIEARRP